MLGEQTSPNTKPKMRYEMVLLREIIVFLLHWMIQILTDNFQVNVLIFHKLSKSKSFNLTTSYQSSSSSFSSLSSRISSLSRNISNLSNASAACTLLPNASAVCLNYIFLLSINLFCALQSCIHYNSLINTIIASVLRFTIPQEL